MAGEGILTGIRGTIISTTGTGLSTNWVRPENSDGMLIHYIFSSTGSLTLESSVDNGANWATDGSAITANTVSYKVPAIGLYRINISANGGTITVRYEMQKDHSPYSHGR